MKKWILDKKLIKQLDFSLLIAAVLIAAFGTLNIYSAEHMNSGISYCEKQIIYIVIALILVYIVLLFDYKFIGNLSFILYWIGNALLLYTDIAAKSTKGAQSWITILGVTVEPSEVIKIGLILLIAKKIDDMDGKINNFKNLLIIAVYSAIPILFIFKEPNYGLAVICICIVFGMLFIAGLDYKIIIVGGLISVAVVGLLVLKFNLLKSYQMLRITSFLDPKNSSQDATLQVDNSILAIGSGGIFGEGFLKGTQVSGQYIPEDHTDFIFAVVGEEWGFIGVMILLGLYAFMLARILAISRQSKDIMGKMICIGYFAALTFSIYQNIGMTIRRAPVAGITLPFMSAGGSSILTNFISLALVLNVGMRRKKINF